MAVSVKREEYLEVADEPTRSSPPKRRRVEVVIELKHTPQEDKKTKALKKVCSHHFFESLPLTDHRKR